MTNIEQNGLTELDQRTGKSENISLISGLWDQSIKYIEIIRWKYYIVWRAKKNKESKNSLISKIKIGQFMLLQCPVAKDSNCWAN